MFVRYVTLLTVVVALAMALPVAASAATTTIVGTVARVTQAGVDTDVMTVQSNVPWELRLWSKGGSDLVTGTPHGRHGGSTPGRRDRFLPGGHGVRTHPRRQEERPGHLVGAFFFCGSVGLAGEARHLFESTCCR